MRELIKRIIVKLGPNAVRGVLGIYRFFVILRYKKYFTNFLQFRGAKIKVGKDTSIFPGVYHGSYEKLELDVLLTHRFKSDVVFWDVGANIGIYSILFSIAFPAWKIFAFEPNQAVLPILKENINKNKCNNVNLVDLALSDSKSLRYLQLYRNRSGGNHLIDNSIVDKSQFMEVESAIGDELVVSGQIPKPDFIKIDCEGHELEILAGLDQTICQFRPIISIEILIENWSNRQKFIKYIEILDRLIGIYGKAFLIRNNEIFNITKIKFEDLDNSLQTLILGLK